MNAGQVIALVLVVVVSFGLTAFLVGDARARRRIRELDDELARRRQGRP